MPTKKKTFGLTRTGMCATVFVAVVMLSGCGSPKPEDVCRAGETAYNSGDYKTARKHFKKYAKMNPKSDVAAYNLGMACLKLNEYRAAADAFKRADSLSADLPGGGGSEALEAWALTLRLSGKPDDALEVYDRAEAKMKLQPGILAGMALCYVDKGKFGLAEKSLLEALSISGGKDPTALFNMGMLFAKQGNPNSDPAKAALYYHNFLRHHRENPEFAAETKRAAQTLADLHRSTPRELNEKVLAKLMEADKFAQNKVKRLNLLFEAWFINPASQDAMNAYIRHAAAAGGRDAAEAKDMKAILDLIQQY